MPLLISVLVFMSTFLLFVAFLPMVKHISEQKVVLKKLRTGETVDTKEGEENLSVTERLRIYFKKWIFSLGQWAKPKKESDISEMEKDLVKAGYRGKNAAIFYYGTKVLLTLVMPALVFILVVYMRKPLPATHLTALLFLFALIGYFLPNIFLSIKISRRKAKFIEGFPDALDLMVVCVEAGMGMDAALNRLTEEIRTSNRPIYEEFRQLMLEMRAGKSRKDALRSLATRVDVEDVTSWVTLLIQTDKFGTSIAQALRVHSDSMRTKRHQRAEEMAAKLPVKLVFPLILFIFPSLFIAILGPSMIQAFRLWTGR
jgi:tight adherence protein C